MPLHVVAHVERVEARPLRPARQPRQLAAARDVAGKGPEGEAHANSGRTGPAHMLTPEVGGPDVRALAERRRGPLSTIRPISITYARDDMASAIRAFCSTSNTATPGRG